MVDLNSNQFPDVYNALGIDLTKLGVVMLDVDPFPVTELVTDGEADLYESDNPNHFWIRGAVAESTAHTTLLYGLLSRELKPFINTVLTGWTIPPLEVEGIGSFESTFPEEPYSCIVAHIKPTPELLEGHKRVSLLPHINTYTEYQPHLTLAYVKVEAREKWLAELGEFLRGRELTVNRINYGENHG